MNFVNSRCLLVVFVYFSAAVLVIVDGQSTTDDDSDKYDISKLIDRIAKLEHNLAVAIDTVAQLKDQLAATTTKPGASKFCILLLKLTACHRYCFVFIFNFIHCSMNSSHKTNKNNNWKYDQADTFVRQFTNIP